MKMHNIGVDVPGVEIEALLQSGEDRVEGLRSGVMGGVRFHTMNGRIFPGDFLIAKTPDLNLAKAGQFTGEILDVDTGSSVDVGRKFVREEE
jgi:hypothetical protein